MIKLTTSKGKTIWINANHIVSVQEEKSEPDYTYGHSTFIQCRESGHHVKETVEEVISALEFYLKPRG